MTDLHAVGEALSAPTTAKKGQICCSQKIEACRAMPGTAARLEIRAAAAQVDKVAPRHSSWAPLANEVCAGPKGLRRPGGASGDGAGAGAGGGWWGRLLCFN